MHDKKTLGYIDCPTCGTAGGMRITHDKNGHPFGFCTAKCRQQLRVGPDPDRVGQFVKRYPFAAAAAAPAEAPAPVPVPVPAAAPAAAPAPAARRRSSLADAVAFLGGGAAA